MGAWEKAVTMVMACSGDWSPSGKERWEKVSGLCLVTAFWRQACMEGFGLVRHHHTATSPPHWL